jgi:hypothetical protein
MQPMMMICRVLLALALASSACSLPLYAQPADSGGVEFFEQKIRPVLIAHCYACHYGATDEFGYKAMTNKVHFNDLHATLLHLVGLNHERLTYRFNGRDFRLTDVAGNLITEILA